MSNSASTSHHFLRRSNKQQTKSRNLVKTTYISLYQLNSAEAKGYPSYKWSKNWIGSAPKARPWDEGYVRKLGKFNKVYVNETFFKVRAEFILKILWYIYCNMKLY